MRCVALRCCRSWYGGRSFGRLHRWRRFCVRRLRAAPLCRPTLSHRGKKWMVFLHSHLSRVPCFEREINPGHCVRAAAAWRRQASSSSPQPKATAPCRDMPWTA